MNDLEKNILQDLMDGHAALKAENNKLKTALYIVMTKCVEFAYFYNNQTVDYYNKHVADWRQLTPEEFELLNELYKTTIRPNGYR